MSPLPFFASFLTSSSSIINKPMFRHWGAGAIFRRVEEENRRLELGDPGPSCCIQPLLVQCFIRALAQRLTLVSSSPPFKFTSASSKCCIARARSHLRKKHESPQLHHSSLPKVRSASSHTFTLLIINMRFISKCTAGAQSILLSYAHAHLHNAFSAYMARSRWGSWIECQRGLGPFERRIIKYTVSS